MAQEQVDYGVRVERRQARRITARHTSLYWSFGLTEGALASLVLLTPALVYHLLIEHVVLSTFLTCLYLSYALVAGIAYGVFSVRAAAKLLENGKHQQSVIAESAFGWTSAFSVALFASFLVGLTGELSRVSLISAYVIGIPVLIGARGIAHVAISTNIKAGRLQYRKAAVIGDRADVVRFLFNGSLWRSGYQLSGTLYFEDIRREDGTLDERAVTEFTQSRVAGGAGYIVFVNQFGDVNEMERIANELKRFSVSVAVAPPTDNTSFKFLDVVPLGANNAVRVLRKPLSDSAVLAKRLFDVCAAFVGLVLLSPVLALVALLIKLDSRGPVFYHQERRGFNGETFYIWKFRSMRVTESGRKMTQARVGDPRITRIGAFIRAKSIDELPQLINVLRGEMSLVGPRPHALVHDDELGNQLATYAHRQRIKPGITGWAQINGYRGETSTFEQIEGRTIHDLYYIENWSLLLDCWIIILTVFSRKTRLNAV